MTEQIRCKNCGRLINKDLQQNFFSLCYDCFRDLKSSNLKQAIAMLVIGIVGLIFVLLFIYAISGIFRYSAPPLRIAAYIIGSLIAIAIPILLIVFGIKKKRKWNKVFKAKQIEPQSVISSQTVRTLPSQKKFCPDCGIRLSDSNQEYCHNCGAEILARPKTDTYSIETPQTGFAQEQRKLQKGPPGKNSKLCFGLAIISIVLAFVPSYTMMYFYYIFFLDLFLNVVGLAFGVLSKIYGSKARKSEPFNNLEKAGSIIVIPAFIFGAIFIMMIVMGILGL